MEPQPSRYLSAFGLAAALAVTLASPAWALQPKQPASFLDSRAFVQPELRISTAHVPLADALDHLPNNAAWEARIQRAAWGEAPLVVFLDNRTGKPSNWIMAQPLLPGRGVGNHVSLHALGSTLGRQVQAVDAALVADLVQRFVDTNRDVLGLEASQLELKATPVNSELWQVTGRQVVNGIVVRDALFAAVINNGNLVMVGTELWGDVKLDTIPRIEATQALDLGFAEVGGRWMMDEIERDPTLTIVPVAPQQFQQGEAFHGPIGQGLGHRLAYAFVFTRPTEPAHWEVLVDAHSGEVLAMQDLTRYATQQVAGGVYPMTNTEQCPDYTRCGTVQSGYPMPFADTGLPAPNNLTSSAGLFDYTSGGVTTTLSGKYFRMNDACGPISASGAGSINLGGATGQHDCATPGFGGAGNTAASRSGFYELNKLSEVARGWLPSNTWLKDQVVANMNFSSDTCNAGWDPVSGTLNFLQSGDGCRNSGEIASVFDHEWGHGLDDNDSGGTLSSSSEGYADIAAIYRLNTSCVGYGLHHTKNLLCGHTADGSGYNYDEAELGPKYCDTDCSGVRDTDYAKHNPPTPATALGFVCNQCAPAGNGPSGPCGKRVHCSAAPVRQMAWDLVKRDLTAQPFNLDTQTALIVGARLFYQGSGSIGAWHSCTCDSSSTGCGATNGYMQWLVADDDNGSLTDGTPHMTAIFNAYDRHGIACSTPSATNSGCSGGPAAKPTLTATPGNRQVALSWTAVSGATRYWVLRGEGQGGCALGKALIASPTSTSYTDTQVANGRGYYYTVVAAGASNACFGRAATCVAVTPGSSDPPGGEAPSNLTASAPVDLSGLTLDAVDLTWQDNSDEEWGFEIWMKTGGGPWEWVENAAANETNRTLWLQQPPTGSLTYTFKMRAFYGDILTDFSNTAPATLFANPPAALMALEPQGCLATDTPLFAWTPAASAFSYYLAIFLDDGSPIVDVPDLHATSYTLTEPLEQGFEHRWKVKGCNNAGCGPWTDSVYLMPFCPPETPPQLLSPKGCVGTTEPTLTWTSVAGATEYRVGIWEARHGGDDIEKLFVNVTTTSYTVPGGILEAGLEYRFRVKSKNATTDGLWSRHRYFTPFCPANAAPGTVSPLSPWEPAISKRPVFLWETASNAMAYYFTLRMQLEDGTWVDLANNWYAADALCTATQCSLPSPEVLTQNRMYRWLVFGYNGVMGPGGQAVYFPVESPAFLLSTQASSARLWALNALGAKVYERTFQFPQPGYTARRFESLDDGTGKLLWSNAALGRGELWTLSLDNWRRLDSQTFQAANPVEGWIPASYERIQEGPEAGRGRVVWFNFTPYSGPSGPGVGVVWPLDGNDVLDGLKNFFLSTNPPSGNPAGPLPPGWALTGYTRARDGIGNRLLVARVQSSYPGGPADGGAAQVWSYDESQPQPAPQSVVQPFSYTPYWFARGYSFHHEPGTTVRMLFGNDLEAKAKVCTYATESEVTHMPVAEGWGISPYWEPRCKTFGPNPGWVFRSYTK